MRRHDEVYTLGILSDPLAEDEVARAHAVSGFYIPAFLRWQVYDEPGQRLWFVAPTHYDLGPEAFPEEIQDSALWEDIYAADTEEAYLPLDERPFVFVGLSERSDDTSSRLQVDTMYRSEQLSCGDMAQPLVSPSAPIEQPVSLVAGLDGGAMCVSDSLSQLLTGHESEAAMLPWGSADAGDGVRWDLVTPGEEGFDLLDYDDLSFRGGRGTGPFGDREAFAAQVVLESGMLDDDGDALVRVPLTYERFVAQDNSAMSSGRFMHTVRFPLGDFCAPAEGLDVTDIRAIEILAVASGDDASFLHVDSLEFTSNEFGGVGSPCPAESGTWACEATLSLVATETACDGEPISGVCSGGDITTTPVALPHVDVGLGFDGWTVDTPAGFISDVNDPDLAEIDRIVARCRAACRREYEGDPHAAANCDASEIFETPYLVESGHTKTRRAIADAQRDGSGLFEEELLTCSLVDDCCSAFDEDLCPAAPWRVTTAESELGRGQEYILGMTGDLKVYSVDDDVYADADAIGTVGYSNCVGGSAEGPCPLYLGSAHAEIVEPLMIEVDCGGVPIELTLESVDVDLVQPAMGINFEDSQEGAFPPGSLVLRTHAEGGPLVVDRVDVNSAAVYAPAAEGWAQILSNGGSKTLLEVNCGPEIKTFEAWFDLNGETALEQPPLVEIDMPGSVACSTPVPLDADVADPDGDEETLRWVVDGILLDDSLTTLTVTQPHEIRAVVTDERGAVTTDVHQITCF